jgi:hypothetical protein
VLHGEAGIGNTALLDRVQAQYGTLRILRIESAEAEAGLPFTALHPLTGPLLRHLPSLPPPQRDALGVALGRRSGTASDHLHLGLAVMGLLSAAAEKQPVVCLVDDVQWTDRGSLALLVSVARRITAQRVASVLTTEDTSEHPELTGPRRQTAEGP